MLITPQLKENLLQNRTLHLLIIAFLVLAVYANTLYNDFSFDDAVLLINNQAVHGLTVKNLKAIFTSVPNSLEYLPVRDFTYALDYQLWGLNPFGYHLSNLLYYLALCLALYLFLVRLLGRWMKEAAGTAFLAALLYALHPVHVESVAGISQRKDVVMGLLFFISLWCFLVYKEAADRKSAPAWYASAVLFFILAMLTKTQSVVLPAMILLLNQIYSPEKPGERLKRWGETLLFFAVGLGLTMLHLLIYRQMGVIGMSSSGLLEKGATALRAVFYYLKLLVIPYPLKVWYEFRISRSLMEPAVIFSLLGMAVLLCFIWKWRKSRPLYSFAGAWYLFCLAPVVGIIPTVMLIAERYLLLPSLGFCLALAWLFHRGLSAKSKRAALTGLLALGLIVIYGFIDFNRNFQWQNMETLLAADLKRNPQSVKLNSAMGQLHFSMGNYPLAFAYFKKSKELEPRDLDYEFYMALWLHMQGKNEEALLVLDRLGEKERETTDFHYLYGRLYQALGEKEKAAAYFSAALKSSRIMGFFLKKDAQEALEELKQEGRGG